MGGTQEAHGWNRSGVLATVWMDHCLRLNYFTVCQCVPCPVETRWPLFPDYRWLSCIRADTKREREKKKIRSNFALTLWAYVWICVAVAAAAAAAAKRGEVSPKPGPTGSQLAVQQKELNIILGNSWGPDSKIRAAVWQQGGACHCQWIICPRSDSQTESISTDCPGFHQKATLKLEKSQSYSSVLWSL